jgi:hypothetical protein
VEIDMSYVNNQIDFRAPVGIQELSFDDVDNVNGGAGAICAAARAAAAFARSPAGRNLRRAAGLTVGLELSGDTPQKDADAGSKA